MQQVILMLAVVAASPAPQRAQPQEVARWERQAQNVTIIRDDWGIAHVYGRTDADAVFGMEYAQAEDDFQRVETNYLTAMGRLAEAEGESQIYRDLRMKLFIHPDSLKKLYAASLPWLQTLMNAFADGLNFYLYQHPAVHPRVIKRFEPWMALSFTEGSIGWDIEEVSLNDLRVFYGGVSAIPEPGPDDAAPPEPAGSNGIAIAPSNTVNHHSLLWINPHTSFYFRSELQMVSDEALNAYGAVTWGQFFVYQGFNATAGWMHTSSGVDSIDEFLETVSEQGGRYSCRYGDKDVPVTVRAITVPYKTATGMAQKTFTAYYTRHGPVVRKAGERWVSISLMQDPVKALTQSYTRTKARNYAEFRKIMELHTNSSNNTIFADAEGNIAYFHANYIPKRDVSLDWTKPVDGSDPATEYHGVLSVDETPGLLNPPSGWLYNSNNWPWSAAGPDSPKRSDYPAYVERGNAETPRGYHALRVLSGKKDFTVGSLTQAAFDSYLPAFARMVPGLVEAYDDLPASDPLTAKLAGQIALLRGWDYRWEAGSVATSLAVFWGEEVGRRVAAAAHSAGMSPEDYVARRASAAELLQSLGAASDKLAADFGGWRTPWGDINRFQRINDDIEPNFDDSGPSIPVPFTSARWGSLASFGARAYPNTRKWYGTSGNSFVAVVEFGDSVRAKAVTAGGESGRPDSPHFNDEPERYASGNLRDVYFYRSQLKGHTEREYHPALALLPQQHQHSGQAGPKLGTVHFATSCRAPAQPVFNQAVALLHSFAFAQATNEFHTVLRTDPRCAMAYWGLGLAAWGNPFAAGIKPAAQIERGLAAVTRARALGAPTERERGYIEAAARLYQHADSLDQRQRLLAYRDAMAELAAREPADTEATIFHALAIAISADPTDKTYGAQLQAGATLERLFAVLPDHPGLAHYIIHSYDVPPLADRALAAAHRYGDIAPDVSHALHMPSHTYTRVGAWQQSIDANIASAAAARREGSTSEELHTGDYRTYAYLQLGQDRAAGELVAAVPAIARRLDPTAIGAGGAPAAGYYAIAAIPARYALERGDWAVAARLDARPSPVPFADAVTYFAQALGAAHIRDTAVVKTAVDQLERLRAVLAQRNESYWSEQVAIQHLAAAAWLAFAEGHQDEALAQMRAAAEREDATEKNAITPGPLAPARELLGEMLLAAQRPVEALPAFEMTLRHEPNRFRAIAGAARAASAAGNQEAARTYYGQLLNLGQHADRPGRPELAEALRTVAAPPPRENQAAAFVRPFARKKLSSPASH